MTAQALHDVLEATGYLANGQPAHGVLLDEEARSRHRTRDFSPDALWRGDSALTVYFKHEQESPSDEQVSMWRREIWNQGFAPLLWVISPEKIELYNGLGRPRKTGDADTYRLRTFRRIEGELDRLDAFAGRLVMETGQFWQKTPAVNRATSVDRQLLSDLGKLERDLTNSNLDRPSAQGLIGRSIFTQYLIDRNIVTCEHIEREYGYRTLAGVLRDRPATERLFDWLRETFNGDMFPSESPSMPGTEYLIRVADFLDATDPDTGQGTLFPYQFDVMPVELISSIYEQFARSNSLSEDTDSETDVFYTRLPLVSLVLDEIMDGLTGEETVLDLTCGSGVFLVEALRRLVTLRSGTDKPSRETIRSALYDQIFGVDISESAVRVAAFSLYLAALELDPNPRPPNALRFKPLIGRTLIVGDAWNVEETPEGEAVLTKGGDPKKFDVIVGNPPWSYPGKSMRAARHSQDDRKDIHSPRGVSLDFVLQSKKFSSKETRFGLILNAKSFFSHSETGRAVSRGLIEDLSPITLVNLSYHSDWLFPHGNLPAIILLARHRPDRGNITAVQVPWSPSCAQTHTFEIAPDDIFKLSLADWRKRPDFLKTAFFGSRRDLELLDRLTSQQAALRNRLGEFDTELRAGLKIGNRSGDSSFLHGFPLLTKDDFRPFSMPSNLAPYNDAKAERPRKLDNYRAPLLLVKEFLMNNGRLGAVASDRDVVFRDAFFGVPLPSARSETAHMLAAILSSSLASWFLLMSASTFGLWMQRVLLRDLEYIPIPDLDMAQRSKEGRRLTELVRGFRWRPLEEDDWRGIDEAVFDLYALDEADRIVVRDGLFRARWQWKRGKLESAAAADPSSHVREYARVFLSAIDVWLSAANRRRMRGEVFDLPESAPLRIVRFVLDKRSDPSVATVIRPDGNLRNVLDRIGERLNVQLGSALVGQRSLRVYGPSEVVVIKPAARRHWMGVSALEDADIVAAESISGTSA